MESKKRFKNKYIICGDGGYYDIGYNDIKKLPCVSYHNSYISGINNSILKRIARLNFSKKVNAIKKEPFSRLVYPILYPHPFKSSDSLCFLFFGHVEYVFQSSYLQYLRETYPNVKLVLYMQDLVRRNPRLDFEYCQRNFDLILSYDKGDCQKYNLLFHPTPMSKVKVDEDSTLPESDIYFCGYAKSRYPLVNELYQKYTDLGLKCDFHLMQYPENEERIDGVHYNEPFFSYQKNIQHVLKTRCVLEVMQEGADGYTPRVWESIVYNRHLLTNNKVLHTSEFFNSSNMHKIEEDNILEWIGRDVNYTQQEQNLLSPVHLLEFIDKQL